MTLEAELDALDACFQGVVPAVLVTCSSAGWPNVTVISPVHRVDARRVALSCQFFNKTRRNVRENPWATATVHHPVTLELHELDLRFDHAEHEGPLFDAMKLRIDAIAAHTGMLGVFRLTSADVYEVLAARRVDAFLEPPSAGEAARFASDRPSPGRGEIHALQLVARRVADAGSSAELVESVLRALEEGCGFEHSMLLVADEAGECLTVVGALGCPVRHLGAVHRVGEGLFGLVATERRTLRFSNVAGEVRYGQAVRREATRAGIGESAPAPLTALADAQSAVVMPLVHREQLVGVIAVESPTPLLFETWHEAFLDVVASHVAVALAHWRAEEAQELTSMRVSLPSIAPPPPRRPRLRYFPSDDCVFLDGEYLVRSLPGRILWKLLREHAATGRTEFTNRELRLDASLGLPALKDNLEARLILLRKRLDERCPGVVRLVPSGRGRFRLELAAGVELEDGPSSAPAPPA